MKYYIYIAICALIANSCSTTRNFAIEDDIYYVPGEKSLALKEIERKTGADLTSEAQAFKEPAATSAGSSQAPKNFKSSGTTVINSRSNVPDNLDLTAITHQAQDILADNAQIDTMLYENTGYWIGGYHGSKQDLAEIQRIINQYPDGFAYFSGNGTDIALNLAFDPDWNVYTDNGRYWWFPSSTNINLYSSLVLGNYPKYIWTVIWDDPSFNTLAWSPSYNWNLNFGWGNPGWSFGFGWNSGWYNPWYGGGWYNGWYDPWYYGWGYPYWHHPHWHPHWDYPVWGGGSSSRPTRPGTPVRPGISRPGSGGSIVGVRPGTRPGVSGSRPSVSRPSGTTRPGTGSSIRPDGNRPSVTTRPLPSGISSGNSGISVRPGSSTTRPSTRPSSNMTRPGVSTRPSSGTTRPGTTVRPPSNMTRPGTTTRPSSPVTRPATPTRPGTISRPATTTRPGNVTRPANNRRPAASNTRSYSRPQSSYRPTYNTNSSGRYNSGSSSRSSYSGSSSSTYRSGGGGSSSGRSSHSTPVRNSGGPRR